jgi:hypothetical protein
MKKKSEGYISKAGNEDADTICSDSDYEELTVIDEVKGSTFPMSSGERVDNELGIDTTHDYEQGNHRTKIYNTQDYGTNPQNDINPGE